MFKRKIIYIILFVLLLSLYQLCLYKETFDMSRNFHFNSNFNVNEDVLPEEKNFISTDDNKNNIIYTNDKNHIFNNNYNAIWLKPQVGYNNENVNDLPSGINDYKEEVTSYSYYINIDTFQKILNDFNKKYTVEYYNFTNKIQNFGKLIPVTNNLGNEKIWKVNHAYDSNRNIPDKFIESKYKDVNIIVKYVLKNINIVLKDYYENIQRKKDTKKFKFYPFFILKYKIVKYYKSIQKLLSINDSRIFEIRICLLRQNDINVFELYVVGYVDMKKNVPIIQNLLFIGNGPVADYLIRSGLSNNNYYKVYKPHLKNDVTFQNVDKIFGNREKYEKNTNEFSLKYQYKCFDINKENSVIGTNNKLDCENEIDWYGRIKDYGVWDKPCASDDECIYFKKNKNYDNNFGKCLSSGYCEMPINTKIIGYHFEKEGSKKKCYNCESKEWKPFTELGDCCEEQEKDLQKERKNRKYPFLNSPDYAFNNDLNLRMNADIQQKYLNNKNYIRYEDLFDKDKFTYYNQ